MKKILVFLAICIFIINEGFGQTNSDKAYFENLQNTLINNSDVESVKMQNKEYKNGTQKFIYVLAKSKSDSLNRFWFVGRCVEYYKNGQLKYSSNYDFNGNFTDESYVMYRKNGRVFYEIEFQTKGEYYVQKYRNGYFYSPICGHLKFYKKNGQLWFEGDLKYDFKKKRPVLDGSKKRYKYLKDKTKVIEKNYKMGKRISKTTYTT